MIDGVVVKKLKVHVDGRGFLMELLRSDDPIFRQFGQVYITGCKRGVAKGWHYHKEQTDHFVCVLGRALVVLVDLREGSPTKGQVEEHILVAPGAEFPAGRPGDTSILLRIPPLVVHGFTALDCPEARIVNTPDILYRYDQPDEYRHPWNSADIPYRWPTEVTQGG